MKIFPEVRLSFRFLRALGLGVLAMTLAGLAGGCAFWPRKAEVPMPVMRGEPQLPRASTLVVFLPGRGDGVERFVDEGMVAELARAGVRADWVVADAHLGYYRDRSVVARLKADVIEPARAAGYRRIVIVGVSLGGLGGLLCERNTPGLVDGLVLLAPFLGDDKALFAEIEARGGAAVWAQGREEREPTQADIAEQLWIFIGKTVTKLPRVWLAYGDRDRLAGGHRLLTPLLPSERVRVIAGGHEWTTWRALWRDLCENSDLFSAERGANDGRPAAEVSGR